MIRNKLIQAFCLLTLLSVNTLSCANNYHDFQHFIRGIKKEARLGGISQHTLNKYLSHLKAPKPKIIKKVKITHKALVPFSTYLNRFIKAKNVNHGLSQLHKHHLLLKEITKQYHVPSEIIVSLWGIESNYGRFTGHSSLVQVLATLSYQHIRSQFYRTQLLYALKMLDQPHVLASQLISSWDGGMGQAQFMPQAYYEYAVAYNHKGAADLWNNTPDALASIANYLHLHGWKKSGNCFLRVTLPKNFPLKQANKNIKKPLSHWLALGVKLPKQAHLKQSLFESTAVIAPRGHKGPAFIGLHNFFILLKWNNSANEALSTCHMAHYFKRHLNSIYHLHHLHAHHLTPKVKLHARRKVKRITLTQLDQPKLLRFN